MTLVTEGKLEYRRTNEVEGKNGKYYLHTFEDEKGSFQLYCKENVTCKKGDMVNVRFSLTIFNGSPQYNMIGIA